MITETGKVIAVTAEGAWVQTIRSSACQACSARHGCGQRALAALSEGRANQVLVPNALNARVGDQVVLAIEESALLGASLLVYALPLLLLVAGTLVGQSMVEDSDAAAMVGAVLGLGSGLALARKFQGRASGRYQPQIVRVCVPAERGAGERQQNPNVC